MCLPAADTYVLQEKGTLNSPFALGLKTTVKPVSNLSSRTRASWPGDQEVADRDGVPCVRGQRVSAVHVVNAACDLVQFTAGRTRGSVTRTPRGEGRGSPGSDCGQTLASREWRRSQLT